MRTEVSIVVPTFREAANVVELTERIHASVGTRWSQYEIIIVDDDSDDGTADVCACLAETYPVRIETRKNERGLATAVLHGIQQAQFEFVVVMDADLSHPPESLPALVRAVQVGAEMSIGSRYVQGGEVDDHWSYLRWLNSCVATWLARPLTRIKDPLAGFFAIRRSLLRNASRLDPIGYKIGLEILVKCPCRVVTEVPIRFADRVHGNSKMDLTEQWKYLSHLKRLYVHKFFNVLAA